VAIVRRVLSRAHRIETSRPVSHVRVLLRGHVLAESDRPLLLQEGRLRPRWYLPREDVRVELLPSETHTTCPFKGEASYYSVRLPDGAVEEDLVWYYPEPIADVREIADHVCFYGERVQTEVDAQLE
jgi:uncharacterized protein (DUF427 family)